MKCKDCQKMTPIGNTNETGCAICTAAVSYFLIQIENDCVFQPKEYTCGDCMHYRDADPACFTVEAEDSIYKSWDGTIKDTPCCGFEDYRINNVKNALADWLMRGYDIDEKLANLVKEFKEEFEIPWEPRNEEK